jgi:carbohydrate diacid regulator
MDAAMAAAFLRKLGEKLDYNVNIMNRDGIIIASRDPARVGSYHAAARHLLESGAAEERIRPDDRLPEGTKPGLNLPLSVREQVLGVVGVTGDPAEVAGIAYAIKTSLESMIELEALRESTMSRRSRKSLLMAYLLYEELAPEAELLGLAEKLGYDPGLTRAAILIRLPPGRNAEDALAAAKAKGVHDSQDIASATPDGSLLVFRRLAPPRSEPGGTGAKGLIAAYRQEIRSYCRALASAADLPILQCCAGTPQRDFSRYRGAYRQAQWLAKREASGFAAHNDSPSEGGIETAFLFDHIHEYLVSLAPQGALDDALATVAAAIPRELTRTMSESVAALEASGFNIKEAAARLGVHRNTLAARFERLAGFFGADPRSDAGALALARAIGSYMELRS